MVSIEKWLGPERAYSDVEVEDEAKKMQEIAMLPTEPAESAVGEWRSFNRYVRQVLFPGQSKLGVRKY